MEYAIVGLGATGQSCVAFLQKQGKKCVVFDTRETPKGLAEFQARFPEVPVITGPLDASLLARAHTILLSPGIAPQEEALQKAVAQGSVLYGDIELFAHYVQRPVIGITGSNGKSTVTTLVAALLEGAGLKVAVGGNLGEPALNLLAQPLPDVYVLELSSFQLETTHSLQLHAATILNISEDHLDRHGSLEAYCRAKQRIYAKARYAIVNVTDPATKPMHPEFQGEIRSFSKEAPLEGVLGLREIEGALHLAYGSTALLACEKLLLKGIPNYENALAAMALASTMGVSFENMLPTLRQFRGLPHRCQWVGRFSEVLWINDSKGTNVGATVAAVEGLASELTGKIVLIAGGDGKGADFSPLLALLPTLRACVLLGKDASRLEALFEKHVPVRTVSTIEDAVLVANEVALPGDAVLLSPACSSLDMFENYAQRGMMFSKAVQKLMLSHAR